MNNKSSDTISYNEFIRRVSHIFRSDDADNTTSYKPAPTTTYVATIADKELLKTLRIMIKSITSLVSFTQEIINVLLLLREQLEKQESALSEILGEL